MSHSSSLPCRAALLAALLVACSDGAGTLPPDSGSYGSVAAGGTNGVSSAGQSGFSTGGAAATGGATAAGGSGGTAFGAAGTYGGSRALPGAGGSGAAAGGFASGATGSPSGSGGSFGSGGLGTGALGGAAASGGRGGAPPGGAGGSLGGHAGALAPGSAGKQAAGGAPASVPATFSAVTSIIQANCSICHGNRMPRLTNNANLYKTLTSTVVKECGNNPLVKPNDPANSALLMLPSWECDDLVMPQGCIAAPCITDSELATISAWIAAGAPSK